MFFVYILFSETLNKFYIGQTDDIQVRIQQHNNSLNQNWTKKGVPWELKISIECKNRLTAIRIERFIKKQKSKAFIQKLIDQPSLVKNIIAKHDC